MTHHITYDPSELGKILLIKYFKYKIHSKMCTNDEILFYSYHMYLSNRKYKILLKTIFQIQITF